MSGFRLAERVIAPECPCCGLPIFLTFGRAIGCAPDGTLVFDGELARAGMLLHLRRCQEDEQ